MLRVYLQEREFFFLPGKALFLAKFGNDTPKEESLNVFSHLAKETSNSYKREIIFVEFVCQLQMEYTFSFWASLPSCPNTNSCIIRPLEEFLVETGSDLFTF